MADYIFDDEVPNQQDFDGTWHTLGVLAGVEGTPNLIGGRAWFPPAAPANFWWVVYDTDDQSLIAEVNLAALPSPTLGGWTEFTSAAFTTPGHVALEPGEGRYAVTIATDGDFVYADSGFSYPIGGGIVIAAVGCFHNGGSGPVFPESTTSALLFADMLVEADGPIDGDDDGQPGTHTAGGTASQLAAAGTSAVLSPSGSGSTLTASGAP